MIIKPMLAGKCLDIIKLRYPVLCTPKLDGIRCLKVNGKCVSRTFKPIPNTFIRNWIEANVPDGCDGELICPGSTFQETTGNVMRESGYPHFDYHIFDYLPSAESAVVIPYEERMRLLLEVRIKMPVEHIKLVLPVTISNADQLLIYEEQCLQAKYEGVMIRSADGPYKFGRSTEREGFLLKLKRFEDCEGKIVAINEGMQNNNEAEKDAFGRTKRSTKQDGLVPNGMMGEVIVECFRFKNRFGIGTGFTEATRIDFWNNRIGYLGRIIKFKYQPSGGTNDAPRFPVFLGFRDKEDM